ncbi:hypothetical protein [Sphingomonas sp. BAUL-RG-20F-R05-02]|uniref:hypothetical protein n=1 Tax=Sphingomonas sp. BAUL-RG-20F-R05-02 TaxID=2914830 RepID=UPI001F5756DB|nr:hypothetical protein [Sphingomonas sp. BAUL-RG-20F-R05-02]
MLHGTIEADGLSWPAQTYVDALRFREIDAFDPPCLDERVQLITIDRDLRVLPAAFADEIDWPRTVAFRPLEHTSAATPCRICGQPSLSIEGDICEPCDDERGGLWPEY